MRLESVTIKNFRCYRDEVTVKLGDLTTFIGRNDIGKSSILEALEIFFNNDIVKNEQGDANIYSGDSRVYIACEFSDLTQPLTLDAGAETTLADEHLLTASGTLKIQKIYDCKTKSPSTEIFISALHPTAKGVNTLLELKEKELQTLVQDQGLNVPLKGNPAMRKALWDAVDDLLLAEVQLPLSKTKEDAKRIWEQLESHLPMFALFQSDRSSSDGDGEVQTPMKAAVAAAIAEVQGEIDIIQRKVKEKAVEIAQSTHAALKTLDPNLAKELTPQFTQPTTAKWTGLFAVTMDTDDGIPLNKRGSGVRRLVLVSFFKAAAERKIASGGNKRSIIYAIEEPETAQHPNNQRILIESFKTLAAESGYQVVLTTHSPGFAAELPADSVRFVTRDTDNKCQIQTGVDVYGPVADALGLVADSRVKVLLCVEGPSDVKGLKCLSAALHQADPTVLCLSTTNSVAFVVLGGSTLQHWVSEHYLKGLGRPEVHIYDNDVAKYGQSIEAVNARGDGSWGALTLKHELESYLHADAIYDAFGVIIVVPDNLDAHGCAVPAIYAKAAFSANPVGAPMGDPKAKKLLVDRAFPLMTSQRVKDRDPNGEVEGWLRKIAEMI